MHRHGARPMLVVGHATANFDVRVECSAGRYELRIDLERSQACAREIKSADFGREIVTLDHGGGAANRRLSDGADPRNDALTIVARRVQTPPAIAGTTLISLPSSSLVSTLSRNRMSSSL